MRDNTAIRPLPHGTKIKNVKKDNYQNLLLANNNNELETKFWSLFLSDLEEKYSLVYKPGKELFQIYYQQGKNDNVNKIILKEISDTVKELTDQWSKINQTYGEFNKVKNATLKDEIIAVNDQLKDLEKEKDDYISSLPKPIDLEGKEVNDFLKNYLNKRQEIQIEYSKKPKVEALNKIKANWEKEREILIENYLKSENKDLNKLLNDLEFKK